MEYIELLPERIRERLMLFDKDRLFRMQELRLRAGRPIMAHAGGQEYFIGEKEAFICQPQEIDDIVAKASRYSVYAYQEELRQGFFTLPGGHRLGLTGQAVMENGKIITFTRILSLCLRIAHEEKDCSLPALKYLFEEGELLNTLIISPPGGGKTTLLRDLIRQVSNGTRLHEGMNVGVVDERWELGACYDGTVKNDLGTRTDVLCGGNKTEGMLLLLRSMSPQVIAADEIGKDEDAAAIKNAKNSGCKVIVSAHGSSLSEILLKNCFKELYRERTFERYVILGNRREPGQIKKILDGGGSEVL